MTEWPKKQPVKPFKWWAEITDSSGERRSVSGYTREDVQRRLDALMGEPVEIYWYVPFKEQAATSA